MNTAARASLAVVAALALTFPLTAVASAYVRSAVDDAPAPILPGGRRAPGFVDLRGPAGLR
jgi:hypothetical protein